jgi:hypothetical protein
LGERLRPGPLSHGWIAFGPGPREGTIAIAGFLFSSGWANEVLCRAGIGIGALLLDGFVLIVLARALGAVAGPATLPAAIEKLGGALVLIALAPILAPMLPIMIAKIFVESFATWRATGRWPRNEAFIQRMTGHRQSRSAGLLSQRLINQHSARLGR